MFIAVRTNPWAILILSWKAKLSRYLYGYKNKDIKALFIIKSIKFLVNDGFLVVSTFVNSHFVQ